MAPGPGEHISFRTLATTVTASVAANLFSQFGPPPSADNGREDDTMLPHRVVPRTLSPYHIGRDVDGKYRVEVEFSAGVGGRGAPVAKFGPFETEGAAVHAALNFAPPVWQDSAACALCSYGFTMLRRKHHCRNCGLCVCNSCCVSWPTASLPESYSVTAGDARAVLRAATSYAAGLKNSSAKELLHNWRDTTWVRVCAACDSAAANFRQCVLDGMDASLVRHNYASGVWKNVNLWRPLPHNFAAGGLMPVHLAVASGSLPLLKFLVLERRCPVDGPFSLTAGYPQKSVLRVGVEHAALDILQWLLCCEDADSNLGLPLKMPTDTHVNAAVVHRALDAALKDAYRLHGLLDQVLNDVGGVPQRGGGGEEVENTRASSTTVPFHAASTPSVEYQQNNLGRLDHHQQENPTAPPLFDDDEDDDLAENPSAAAAASDQVVVAKKENTKATECVVCFSVVEGSELCALVPCGHACVCLQCGGSLSACPMCRERVDKVMRIFVE